MSANNIVASVVRMIFRNVIVLLFLEEIREYFGQFGSIKKCLLPFVSYHCSIVTIAESLIVFGYCSVCTNYSFGSFVKIPIYLVVYLLLFCLISNLNVYKYKQIYLTA